MSIVEQLAKHKVASIADALDYQQLYDQCLPPELKLLARPTSGRFVGRAKTLCFRVKPPGERNPLRVPREVSVGVQRKFEAHVTPGDVVVFTFDGDYPPNFEAVGGFIATLFHQSGAVGIVVDGYIRDVEEMEAMNLGVVARGMHPAIMQGRVTDLRFGEPATIGGVTIREGDLVAGDINGTVVIPDQPALHDAMVSWLEHKAELEVKAWADVAAGERVSDVFNRYGVL